MRYLPEIIGMALDLYERGLSLGEIERHLKLYGVKVTRSAILHWVRKYKKPIGQKGFESFKNI
jgi:transposase-like protein